MVLDPTPLDRAHAAMTTSGDDDSARLRYFETLAATEVFLLLDDAADDAADGDEVSPKTFDLEDGTFVLGFDREDRLANFVGGPAPYAALPGRALAALAAPKHVGLGLNLGIADSEMLLPSEALSWLANLLSVAPEQAAEHIDRVFAPFEVPETLLQSIDGRLARCTGLARHAYLVRAEYSAGRSDLALFVIDALPDAQPAIAGAISEAATFSGDTVSSLDLVFLENANALVAQLERVGLRFDIPEPRQPSQPEAPGTDPQRPPQLR